MYVKALRKGYYDTVGTGKMVEIRAGTVFQVPDNITIGPKSWVVKCDKQGKVIDPVVAREDANKAREKANKEAEQAKAAAARAERERKQAEEAEARARELEAAASKGGQPSTPPAAP